MGYKSDGERVLRRGGGGQAVAHREDRREKPVSTWREQAVTRATDQGLCSGLLARWAGT